MKTALFALFENWEDDYQKAITDQINLICYAEELGFDEAWITEHHFNNFSVIPSPLSVVSYLLGKTKSIKIGTAAILLPYYNPISNNTPLQPKEDITFKIKRTHTNNLPVYTDYKHHHEIKFTIIRNIIGNVNDLANEIKKITSNSDVEIKTGKIMVKGIHLEKIRNYLLKWKLNQQQISMIELR